MGAIARLSFMAGRSLLSQVELANNGVIARPSIFLRGDRIPFYTVPT